MLRGTSFPSLAASAAPFAAASLQRGFSFSKKNKIKPPLSSLTPLKRSLTSATPTTSSTSSTSTSALKALSSRDAPPPPALDFQLDSLAGRWQKLKSDSDDMKAACEAVELNKILRMGVSLVNTLEIVDEREGADAHFATTLKAGGILDVKEKYPWSEAEVEHSRRDKRRGKHLGKVSLVEIAAEEEEAESEGGEREVATTTKQLHPRISVTWGDPRGGECTDTFVLSRSGRRLTQLSVLAVRGKEVVAYKTVFTR